jgi:hypothetical protein
MILLGFENLSRLKNNFSKNELVLNLTSHEGLHYANYIGCNLSSFPTNYLGVPLHWTQLKNED